MTDGRPEDGPVRRRGRNVALALVLAAWVLLMYALTFVKMGTPQ
jgi:hypothetical protein